MSTFASPASGQLQRSLEVPLTLSERARIVLQLGTAMIAVALLGVGWIQMRFGPPDLNNLAELIFASAAGVVALPIFWEALRGVVARDPQTFTSQLVALATLAAMMTGNFVTATLIPVIMNVGHFLEERSVLGAQAAIQGLRGLHARAATIVAPEGERSVSPDALAAGDVLLVRPGEVIAADGEVIDGCSAVDQSSITGESVPEDLGPGQAVYAGSVNLTGVLRVRVTKTGRDTALGKVVRLLREAEQSKTPVLKLIERYAGYYVPAILIVAAIVLFVSRDMSRAVAVLVVGCPGAFVLAGPTAMIAALASASRLGILIKNTKFLESLADVDTVILDKTGTITLGRLDLISIDSFSGLAEREVLGLAACCATGSRHPISQAVVLASRAAGIEAKNLSVEGQVREIAGMGVVCNAGGVVILLGRREWLIEEGIRIPDVSEHLGPTVWLARRNGQQPGTGELLACLRFADTPRPEAKSAIEQLRGLGVSRTILLTGDRREVAQQIGEKMEVDEIISEVLPEQKLEVVRRESDSGNSVMMVGDGINDALALASGDVGVALGAVASDVAIQSADVALMTNDLGRLPLTVRLARLTRSTIHQNILLGALISIVFVWLASVGRVSPLVGAVLHNVGELVVIGNSARLLGFAGRNPAVRREP
jgi:Zn2+/Cd2+-exporting ATPase